MPGLGQQPLGGGDVRLLQREVLMEMVGGVHRHVVARRAVALGDEADHRVPVHRQGQRLAHADIVEGWLRAIHVHVEELAGRHAQRLDAAGRGQARELALAGIAHQVRIARDQRRGFRRGVREDHDLDPVQIRARRVVVALVARHDERRSGS
jgi:hypothetical protein